MITPVNSVTTTPLTLLSTSQYLILLLRIWQTKVSYFSHVVELEYFFAVLKLCSIGEKVSGKTITSNRSVEKMLNAVNGTKGNTVNQPTYSTAFPLAYRRLWLEENTVDFSNISLPYTTE